MKWSIEKIKDVGGCHASDFAMRKGNIVVAVAAYLLSIMFGLLGVQTKKLQYLLLAHRLTNFDVFSIKIKKFLPVQNKVFDNLVSTGVQFDEAYKRSIVLKDPVYDNETLKSKGILLITFTRTLSYYYHHINISELLKDYHLVLEPSWAGYADVDILFWTKYEEPIIVQATEIRDRKFISRLDSNLFPVSFGASDWVDYRLFTKIDNSTIIYDAVYVANLNPIKRIHSYFHAIREIKRKGHSINAALVTASWGGRGKWLDNLLDYYDVRDLVTCFQEFTPAQVNEIFNQSKVSVLLSLKEGSNRTLFESIFADTPVIALAENIGINKEYINDQTGMLVQDNGLADALLAFKTDKLEYHPREWAFKNIAPEVTRTKLVEAITKINNNANIQEKDVAIKINSPKAIHMYNEDTIRLSATRDLLTKFNNANV